VGDLDGPGLEVDLGPESGESFADPYTGAEHERDQVGEVCLVGAFIGGQALPEERDFFGGEGSGWILGFGLDGIDLADGVDGDRAVDAWGVGLADAEFAEGRAYVVPVRLLDRSGGCASPACLVA
jgi:hypothetical protein